MCWGSAACPLPHTCSQPPVRSEEQQNLSRHPGEGGDGPPKLFPKGAFPKHPKGMWSEGWCPTHECCGHAPARLPQDILLRQLGERRVHELSALQTRARCCNFGSRWARSAPASQPQPPWQHARPFPKAGAQLPFSLPAIWTQKPPAAAGGCISRWGPFRHGQVLSWESNSASSPTLGSEGQPRGRSNGALVLPEPPSTQGGGDRGERGNSQLSAENFRSLASARQSGCIQAPLANSRAGSSHLPAVNLH